MTDEDHHRMFEQWQRLLDRRQTFIAITDTRAIQERGSPK
jgi:hypothetical protein